MPNQCIIRSEWADDVNSALESGKRNLQVLPSWMPDDTAVPDPVENAKMYLKTLQYNQRVDKGQNSKFISAGSVDGQYKDRVVLHKGADSNIVQARDKESGKSVILKVLSISVAVRAVAAQHVGAEMCLPIHRCMISACLTRN